jgi:hypothetical protein
MSRGIDLYNLIAVALCNVDIPAGIGCNAHRAMPGYPVCGDNLRLHACYRYPRSGECRGAKSKPEGEEHR